MNGILNFIGNYFLVLLSSEDHFIDGLYLNLDIIYKIIAHFDQGRYRI